MKVNDEPKAALDLNLYLRVFAVWLLSFFRPRLGFRDTSYLCFPVFPGDLDLYLHMNNGRYLSVMDLGRFDLILRSRLLNATRKHKWFPVVAEARIRYRRPLHLFQAYRLTTRITGWDEKWFYLEQVFERKGCVHATGWIRGTMVGKSGRVAVNKVLKAAGVEDFSSGFISAPEPWRQQERF